MPLIHGKSKKSFDKNVATEMHEGKHQKQALAIAYSMKRKAKKMAEGGMLTEDGYQPESKGHTIHIHVNPKAGYEPTENPHVKSNEMAEHEDARMLNQHGKDEVGPGGYADGGLIKDLPPKKQEKLPPIEKMEPEYHADGGFIGSHQTEDHEEDMVGRILKKMGHQYSEGGRVANEDSGESTSDPESFAKADENEFDDLASRDDLAFDYTDENSGDELSSKLNQEDGEDMIGRIMRKRAKK